MDSYFELLTSRGPAAIAIVRFGGPAAATFVARHVRFHRQPAGVRDGRAHAIRRATLVDPDGAPLDDILLSEHAADGGADWRLHLHGSPWIVERVLEFLRAAGFSEPSRDAPAVWDCVDALDADAQRLLGQVLTLRGARWLLANVGRLRAALVAAAAAQSVGAARAHLRAIVTTPDVLAWFTRPVRIALIGPPNAGKSTLMNALVGRSVSIASPVAGTTRDWVAARAEADGFPVAWLDTAGLHGRAEGLESAGVAATRRLIADADGLLVVLDAAPDAQAACAAFVGEFGVLDPALVALNKADLVREIDPVRQRLPRDWADRAIPVSAARGTGLDRLLAGLPLRLGRSDSLLESPCALTVAQREAVRQALAARTVNEISATLAGMLAGRRQSA